ncbi:prephenate dehydratase [Seinonella peptonophila]|uniref:Prephenate dehydratase n=1 Tax=Seinonella peptonophila TaxID=112248 RepID=A0A1M4TSG9_9BACL|nr:prephenate dehydratase [Seinonella peptonophila]SHE47440.1 prephenate dehydratase [Seinonella peptonophila]
MVETIAYLGPQGTFTHEATQLLFSNKNSELVPYPTIPDVLTAVDQGVSDLAVVPVETAVGGSVNLTIDWLIHHVDVPIIGEVIYPISQCLLVHPQHANRPLQDFVRIYSHPQAIAQCQEKIDEICPQAEIIYTESTAQGATILQSNPEDLALAIGTKRAGETRNLVIKEEDIQDHQNNFTRFIAIGHKWVDFQEEQKSVKHKTSLQVTLPSDYPGALFQVLATFSWRKINLSHIESRPTKTGLGNYFFIIDAELSHEHVLMRGALAEIKALGCNVRVLGSYPSFQVNELQSLKK